jgi:DNA polymerase/3'-5' exonuclease PolX|tara:strand:- start:1548 stop:2465 length:918 start_codon:yes stop_codon:yes gene_type:complete
MNVTSVTDYILKLEKLNTESRTKIEQLKKMLTEANEEKVAALNELNDLKNKSLYHTTARVTEKCVNQGLVERLLELGEMTSDFYKTAAYNRGAEILRGLDYEVESGESVMHLKGIGKSIATKIDEYLEEQDPDYEESVASNDYESDEDTESEVDSDDEYFVSYNHDIYSMLKDHAKKESNPYKIQAYENAAGEIYYLPFRVTSGKDAMNLPGIGKSIATKIDDFLTKSKGPNTELADCFLKLGNLEDCEFRSEAYWYAADKLREMKKNVSAGKDVRHRKGFGPSICSKIDEFIRTGTMKRLCELN